MFSPVDEPLFQEFAKEQVEQSIPERFAVQVARHPERLAVSLGSVALTYSELNRRANGFANAILARLGAGSEAVALLLSQGPDLVAAILGVLKAGKFYLGLDADYPAARLKEMVGDARVRFIVASRDHRELAESLVSDQRAVLLEEDWVNEGDREDCSVIVSPSDLAYIFYTSGSSGRPKGVIDNHRNVLHNIMRYTNTLRIGPADRMTLMQSPSFSGSVSSLFGAILNGACSCPLDLRANSPAQLARWLKNEQITIYHSVPVIFRQLLAPGAAFPHVRVVRLEGDQAARVDLQLFAKHFSGDARLVNGLGTTETGLVRQLFLLATSEMPGALLPVGYPVQDMEVLIVDDARKPIPRGEIGEIAVRSRYLAVGYWENPSLTAQRFLADENDAQIRTYLTGDLGRLRADDCLEHLGRTDSRVKVRGQAVELTEVETSLLDLPTVTDAAVVLRGSSSDNPRLIAYYVAAFAPGPSASDLRRELQRRLPAYMIPAAFIGLPALPRNENGKLDRTALPDPGNRRPELSTPYRLTRNMVEIQLRCIWERVLGVEPIGVYDDFFDLGGDSLAAMTMLAQVNDEFALELPASLLLAGGTIDSLAASIRAEHPRPAVPVIPIQSGEGLPPFFFLHGDYMSGGFYSLKLAREMGADVSFYAVTPCGTDGGNAPASFEEMADRHLAAVRAVQPHGPYYLGGTCNGGLIAYEMARRLEADGQSVRLLALFVASASNLRFRRLQQLVNKVSGWFGYPADHRRRIFVRLREIALNFSGRGSIGAVRYALYKSIRLPGEVKRLMSRSRVAPGDGPQVDLRAHYLLAEYAYMPQPYSGPVVLLWPEGESETAEQASRWWRQLTPNVETRMLPSTHHACLTADVKLLASELADALRAASGSR
jgi:amino acid adenylation domain-containing protein